MQVCAPVVVIFAPLGSFLSSHFHRYSQFTFLYSQLIKLRNRETTVNSIEQLCTRHCTFKTGTKNSLTMLKQISQVPVCGKIVEQHNIISRQCRLPITQFGLQVKLAALCLLYVNFHNSTNIYIFFKQCSKIRQIS